MGAAALVYIAHPEIKLIQHDQNVVWHTIAFVNFVKVEFLQREQGNGGITGLGIGNMPIA